MDARAVAWLGAILLVGCGDPSAPRHAARCGDGVKSGAEECDDGPANGAVADACRPGCTLPRCGDGIRDTGEECDDGAGDDDRPGACRSTCTAPRCGDGVVDPGEECDDGAANDDLRADACRATCVLPSCGDGVTDSGEACDDGAGNDDDRPDACRTHCVRASCGDAVVDTGETCDDGESNSDLLPDRCRTDCGGPRCGDGVRDEGEGCDAGDGNSDVRPGACRTTCIVPRCGDGVADPGEECDQGAANSDTAPDTCRVDCILPTCGDRVVDRAAGEACDDGDHYPTDGCDECAWRPECDADEPQPIDAIGAAPWNGEERMIVGTLVGATDDGANIPCHLAPAIDVLYAVPVPREGDLVVRVRSTDGSFVPSVEVFGDCHSWQRNTLACENGAGPDEPAIVVVPGVAPSDTIRFIQIESAAGEPGPFELSVQILDPIGGGRACRRDAATGACGSGLACLDPDGDGLGTCGALVPLGGACDPGGRETACIESACTCATADCVEGVCTSTCGDGIVQSWEECDDGDVSGLDNCTPACRNAGSSCETPFRLDLAAGPDGVYEWRGDVFQGSSNLTASCGHTGAHPEVFARFTAPASGAWVFRVVRAEPPPEFGWITFLPVLSIATGGCGALAELACGELTTVSWAWPTVVLDLAAGETVWAIVDGELMLLDPPPYGGFSLLAERVSCGDGVVGMTEECDDGNASDADHCLTSCIAAGASCTTPWMLDWDPARNEAVWDGYLSRGGGTFSTACSSSSYQDMVARFVAPATGRYTFQTHPGILAVRTDPCQPAANIDCENGIDWTLSAGEALWVIIDSSSEVRQRDAHPFELRVQPVICGDGKLVFPEQCDDGNLSNGDGCSSACLVEAVAESEPNNSQSSADSAAVGSIFTGRVSARTDSDWFRFEAVAGVEYHLRLSAASLGACVEWSPPHSARMLSGDLDLYDGSGRSLRVDRRTTESCEDLYWTASQTGTVYGTVSAWAPVGPYFLEIR
jgi:cysteine-rich repeat protein